jgi:phosphopantetheine adenylyltransferase
MMKRPENETTESCVIVVTGEFLRRRAFLQGKYAHVRRHRHSKELLEEMKQEAENYLYFLAEFYPETIPENMQPLIVRIKARKRAEALNRAEDTLAEWREMFSGIDAEFEREKFGKRQKRKDKEWREEHRR